VEDAPAQKATDQPPTVPVPGQAVPASAIPQLTGIAADAAKMSGGCPPESASVVVTTHLQALSSADPPGH
jgi:hypothetical protein